MKEKNVNPYPSLYDGNNAIKEYYKLKQMLCLTEAEREKLGISEWSDYVRYREYNESDNKR